MVETYLEPSIYAYKLLNKVTQSLNINEPPEMSVQNGNVGKIITYCNKTIEANYNEKRTRELLKYYIARSFFADYNLESDEDYSDELLN